MLREGQETMRSLCLRSFYLCVLVALGAAWVYVPAIGTSRAQPSWTTAAVNASSSPPVDIHASSSYVRSYPRDLIVNYSYVISAAGRSFEISIRVAQSFAYANVTSMKILVNPQKPFTYSMGFDELGNDVLTIRFESQTPLGQFYLMVLQQVTVYSIKYAVDPAKVGSYNKSSELYKIYTKPAPYLESDNAEIIAASRQAVEGETNPYLAARKIQKFVVRHMTYDAAAVTPWKPETEGALFALRSGKGVCRHYPALFTALARAAGIPTADIWGSTPTDGGILTDPGDLKHNWVQFYVPNYGWVVADPARENTQGIDWFAQLQDNSHVPIMSVNYLVERAWWSGGDAVRVIGEGAGRFGVSGEEPVVSGPTSVITANMPQEISWNALSDATGDLIDQNGRAAGDLGLTYLDVTKLSYGSTGESLCFRFDLRGQLPSRIDATHVSRVWYQLFIDVNSGSATGFLWRSDFTPDYCLEVGITSETSRILYSFVTRYAGTGKDWKWPMFDYGTQQPILAGGIGHDFLVMSCRYEDISVSKGSEVRVLARSGVLYDGKVYNDMVPDESIVTMTLPSSTAATTSSRTTTVTTTPLSTSTIGSVTSAPAAQGAEIGQLLVITPLAIAMIGITLLAIRVRRPARARMVGNYRDLHGFVRTIPTANT